MKLIRSTAFLLLLVPFAASAADRWPDAYSRRDFKLGMSISAFQKTPYPDPDQVKGAYAVCSNDKKAGRDPYQQVKVYDDALKGVGGIMCRFFAPSGSENFIDSEGRGLGFAGESLYTDFYFMPDQAGAEPVLFRIETRAPARMLGELLPVLTQAYGQPAHKVIQVTNGLGGSIDDDIYEWSKGESTISYYRYAGSLEGSMIIHELTPLADQLRADKERSIIEKSKKL